MDSSPLDCQGRPWISILIKNMLNKDNIFAKQIFIAILFTMVNK